MKRINFFRILFFGFVLFSVTNTFAQRSKVSVGVSPVLLMDGYGGTAHINFHHKMTDFIQANVFIGLSNKEVASSNVEYPNDNYLFNLGYFTTLFSSPDKGISLFLGGGASLGLEHINQGNLELSDGSILLSEGGFVYGGFASLDLDWFLNESLSLTLPVNGFYHPNSNIDEAMFFVGVGIRYYIN